jgi:ribose-phosphate pyrophosphokinase
MIVVGDGFGKSLAEDLKSDYVKVDRRVFPDGELCPRIELNEEINVDGSDVILAFQKFRNETPNDYLMNFLITLRNLKDMGAKRVICVFPYMTYARQDKKFRDGEPFTVDIVAKLLDFSGADYLITLTSHTHRRDNIIDLFGSCEAYNVSGIPALAEQVKKMNLKNPFILGPDGESIQWAEEMAKIIGTKEFASLKKQRDVNTGEIKTISQEIDLKSKDVVIVDDIISTGKTMLNAIKFSREAGANSVTLAAVHGLMVGDIMEQFSKLEVLDVVTTNTVENPVSKADVIPLVSGKIRELI